MTHIPVSPSRRLFLPLVGVKAHLTWLLFQAHQAQAAFVEVECSTDTLLFVDNGAADPEFFESLKGQVAWPARFLMDLKRVTYAQGSECITIGEGMLDDATQSQINLHLQQGKFVAVLELQPQAIQAELSLDSEHPGKQDLLRKCLTDEHQHHPYALHFNGIEIHRAKHVTFSFPAGKVHLQPDGGPCGMVVEKQLLNGRQVKNWMNFLFSNLAQRTHQHPTQARNVLECLESHIGRTLGVQLECPFFQRNPEDPFDVLENVDRDDDLTAMLVELAQSILGEVTALREMHPHMPLTDLPFRGGERLLEAALRDLGLDVVHVQCMVGSHLNAYPFADTWMQSNRMQMKWAGKALKVGNSHERWAINHLYACAETTTPAEVDADGQNLDIQPSVPSDASTPVHFASSIEIAGVHFPHVLLPLEHPVLVTTVPPEELEGFLLSGTLFAESAIGMLAAHLIKTKRLKPPAVSMDGSTPAYRAVVVYHVLGLTFPERKQHFQQAVEVARALERVQEIPPARLPKKLQRQISDFNAQARKLQKACLEHLHP